MKQNINSKIYNELKDDELSLIYLGQFDNAMLSITTDLWKKYMSKNSDTEGQKNKLAFLMVESFQNILRYGLSGRAENETSGEIFIVRRIGNSYYIITGNYIDNSKIDSIKNRLSGINSKTDDELKQLFVETLTNKKISKEGGAGLGFVEMIRKTKEKLGYKFTPVDNNRSFFYLQLRLKITDDPTEPIDIERSEIIKKNMEQSNTFIAIKGDFDRNAVNQTLQMAENNIATLNPELTTQRKVYHIMVEMIQNIAKHAISTQNKEHHGLFSIGKQNNNYILTTTNYINQDKTEKLKTYIDSLNNKTPEQLNEYYKTILRNGHDDQAISSGLGLIDIARESKNGIKYTFDTTEQNKQLFTIQSII